MAKVSLRTAHKMSLVVAFGLFLLWAFVKPPTWYLNAAAVAVPALLFVVLWIASAWWLHSRERGAYPEKVKRRSVVSDDMYGLIDRMLDNLDPEERDYLRRRMDETESRLVGENWRVSLDSALDERESGRRLRR